MIGETLGSYRIVKTIGEGGMGVVYRAVHTALGRRAAIKVLLPELSSSRDLVDRFFREARTAATIHHPGIVEVFDFGHDANGTAYLVMELLEGESLAARLERESRLPVEVALAIARQVASALHAAHDKGIVHRDLKPENLFLTRDPEVPSGVRTKVLDFGIAKLTRSDESIVKTKTGMIIGTPRYMSPEQCRDSTNVDHRADIYALGCILYEMVLGVRVFTYNTYNELVGAHMYETPARPCEVDPSLPPIVETVILRAIAKNVTDRYSSMVELVHAIEAAWRDVSGGVGFTPLPTYGDIGDEATELADADVLATSPPTMGDMPRHHNDGSTLPLAVELAHEPPAPRRTWLPFVLVLAVGIAITSVAILGSSTDGNDRGVASHEAAPPTPAPPTPPPASHAPPAVPPSAPTAPAAEPTNPLVRLTVDSDPRGADVYRAADGVKLGKTPFEHSYERIDGEAEFVVKLAGYADARVALSTMHDGTFVAPLVRTKRPSHTTATKTHVKPPDDPQPPPDSGSAAKSNSSTTSHGTLLDPYGGK